MTTKLISLKNTDGSIIEAAMSAYRRRYLRRYRLFRRFGYILQMIVLPLIGDNGEHIAGAYIADFKFVRP